MLANLQLLDRLIDPATVSEKMLELLLSAPPEVGVAMRFLVEL